MKYLGLVLLITAALFLSACFAPPHRSVGMPENPTPLDSLAQVVFVNAAIVPLLPPEFKYLGTVQTEADVGCSDAGTVGFLREEARRVGANIVYVKNAQTNTAFLYTQYMTTTYHCLTLHVDLLYAEAPLITRWQEQIKAAEEKEKKERK
jgi:hypothetical protein